MEIAKYFASLSVKIQNSDIKSVDAFLNNIGKGIKTNTKSTDTLEKAVKKETKTTVDGAKSKVSAQKAVNKETAAAVVVTNKLTQAVTNQQKVIRRNAESINKLFPAMGRSPLPARSRDRADAVSVYKDMFKAADVRIKDLNKLANKVREEGNLLGRIGRNSPHFANLPNMNKMREVTALGRIGKNAQAFSSYGKVGSYQSVKAQRVSGEVSALGRIGRNSSTYGAPTRGSLQERLAAFRSNRVEGVQVQSQIEASERRILDLKRREDSRRLTHQQTVERMALRHEQKLAEIREKNAGRLGGQRSSGQWTAPPGSGGSSSGGRRSAASNNRANYLHAGGATGAFMRYGAASLPLIGGVYGASALNTANQDLVNANISAESVLGGRSKELLDRLSERSNYMGINYADTLPQFTKFMASSMPLMGVDSSQQTFESFMQFGRTRGASKVSMNRALTAVGQMSAKGQVMAEELKGQLGDAAGFGEVPQLFAEAYQIQTGGNLTGAKARAALMDAMQNGQVKTADILPLVAKLMDELSKGGIEKARMSSSAQQMRAENAISGRGGLLQTFSESGGEIGFARLWSSFAVAMKESKPAVESLSRAFNEISKYTSFAMLLPQSFKRAFEGRDSWVADALGEQNTATAKALYEGMKELGGEITKTLGIAVDGWKMIFAEFGDEMLSFVNGLKNFFLYTVKAINAMVTGDFTGATNASNALRGTLAGKSQEEISALASGGGKPVSLLDMATGAGQTWAQYTPPVLMAGAVKDAYGWAGEKTGITPWAKRFGGLMDKGLSDGDRASIDYQREMAMSREQFKASQNNQVNISSGAIVINANTSDPEALSEILMSKLKDQSNYLITGQYTEALVHFPEGG